VRLAVLRFENLSPAAAPDWAGRALADVVISGLTGSTELYAIPAARLRQFNAAMGSRPVTAPGISAEAPLAIAAGANRIGYGTYAVVSGRLRARLTIEDPAAQRTAQGPIEVSVAEGDVIGAGAALAKAISAAAQPYGTSSEAALEAYARSLENSDPAATAAGAERAIAADPNFGSPYAMLAEIRAQQQGRAGAEPVLKTGLAHAAAMRPFERVRLEMLDASVRGDPESLERAAAQFVKVAPLDPAAWRAAAQLQAQRRRWQQAIPAYQRALELEPEDAAAWNELGYTAAYGGNFDLARAATLRYQQLRPSEANPIDTRGDIELMAGRLADAERLYLEAWKKDPQFLGGADIYKAAMARLMTGDVAGADGVLKQGAEALASSPEWLWLGGRRSQAFAVLAAHAPKLPQEAQSRAYTHLAIWALLLGDRANAARAAQQAAATATQATAVFAAVARFVTQPSTVPAEWSARAAQMFPNAPPNSIKDFALAYALLLDRHFEAAIPIFSALDAHTPANGDRGAAIALAWALVELGRWKDAAPLVALNPVPNIGTTSVFVPLYFPRLFEVRAAIAEREGKTAAAQENRRIYAALSGK
jgi:Flp pilus assembly protein TadD